MRLAMPKFFLRIVVFLLIPSLAADSVTAAPLMNSLSVLRSLDDECIFSRQALALYTTLPSSISGKRSWKVTEDAASLVGGRSQSKLQRVRALLEELKDIPFPNG